MFTTPDYNSFFTRIIKILVGAFIFLVTIELSSWFILKLGFPPLHQSHIEVSTSLPHVELLREWKKRHPEINNPRQYDQALRFDPNNYHHTGLRTKKYLLTQAGLLTPGFDDIYVVTGMNSGKEKYRVRYRINDFGRRITDAEKNPGKMNIILLGCSFTFGEGLPDESTLSGVLGVKSGVRVYNLGIPAGSPAMSLNLLQKKAILTGIYRKLPTIAIYTFIDDHMRRILATSEQLRIAYPIYLHHPFYVLKDGGIRRDEYFLSDPLSFRWLLQWYGKTNFHQATGLELPRIGEKENKLLIGLFAEMKNELSLEFKDVKFYVSGYPGGGKLLQDKGPALKEFGIQLLDYSSLDLHSFMNGHQDLGTDPHPSFLANDLYSELLLKDLNLQL
jgi:hypothetical protein